VSHVVNSPAEEIVNALEITGELFCTTRGKELVLLIGQVCQLLNFIRKMRNYLSQLKCLNALI